MAGGGSEAPLRRSHGRLARLATAISAHSTHSVRWAGGEKGRPLPRAVLQAGASERTAAHTDVPVVLRVVLTGGPCGGKTTALPSIAAALRSRGIPTVTVEETATSLVRARVCVCACVRVCVCVCCVRVSVCRTASSPIHLVIRRSRAGLTGWL